MTLTVNGLTHTDVDGQRIPVDGTAWDLRTGPSVADLTLDDCWVVSSEASGGSTHTLHSPEDRVVSLWADAQFGFPHVFIAREFPKDGGRVTAIALEPMTTRADAFNSGIGLRWLTPEDGLTASWAVRYEHTKPSR
jgi:aldose 1-epimerase